jgi:uncharacterized protein
MKQVILLALIVLTSHTYAQTAGDTAITKTNIILLTATGKLRGSLSIPVTKKKMPVVLIIAGSGPTDRNSNIPKMVNSNSYKILADSLLQYGIASLRYDKRGIAESKDAAGKEEDFRFIDMVNDAAEWIALLKKDKRFSSVIVLGHSEGSFVGMMGANKVSVDKYISVAGPGSPAQDVIRKQLQAQPKNIRDAWIPMIDTLATGQKLRYVPAEMYSLFRPSVQPYLIDWFRYDPRIEIAKLTIPVLIVNGTTDIQVGIDDANNLHIACRQSKLVLVEGMSHLLKDGPADRDKNIALYNSIPNEPVKTGLVQAIVQFIKTN